MAPQVLVSHAADLADGQRVAVHQHHVFVCELHIAVDLQRLARVFNNHRIRAGHLLAQLLHIVHRPLVHDDLVGRQDVQRLGGTFVQVLLRIAYLAHRPVGRVVALAPEAPHGHKRYLVVVVGAGLLAEQPLIGVDGKAHLHHRAGVNLHQAELCGLRMLRVLRIKGPPVEPGVAAHGGYGGRHFVPALNELDPLAPLRETRRPRKRRTPAGVDMAEVLPGRCHPLVHVPGLIVLVVVGQARLNGPVNHPTALGEHGMGNVRVDILPAKEVAGIRVVTLCGVAVVEGVAPVLTPKVQGLSIPVTANAHLQPAYAALDGIGKRHRAVPGQLVGIAHILHQLGLDLGECLVVLLPRQYLVVHPGATLRADDPVNGRFDLVEHQGRLPALNERLRIFLRPLHAVVEVFIQRLLKAVAGLPVPLGVVPTGELVVQSQHGLAVKGALRHAAGPCDVRRSSAKARGVVKRRACRDCRAGVHARPSKGS